MLAGEENVDLWLLAWELPDAWTELVVNVPLIGALAVAVYALWRENKELKREMLKLLGGFVEAAKEEGEPGS